MKLSSSFFPLFPKEFIYWLQTYSESLFLMQISPEDIQWVGEDPGISHRSGYGGFGHGINRSVGHDSIPSVGRGRGVTKGHSRKDFLPSQNGIGKKAPEDIKILQTDNLIKEVSEIGKYIFSCKVVNFFPSV